MQPHYLFTHTKSYSAPLFFMNYWMRNFAYKTEISIWVFVIAGGIALITALITVSSQSLKIAAANPVKALRYEQFSRFF